MFEQYSNTHLINDLEVLGHTDLHRRIHLHSPLYRSGHQPEQVGLCLLREVVTGDIEPK